MLLRLKKVDENFFYRNDRYKVYSIIQLKLKIRNEIKKNHTLLKT